MKFASNFLRRYLELAPIALAVERTLECEILATQSFEGPILDLGCGDGIFAAILFAEKVDLGIDLDPIEIGRARSLDVYRNLIECAASNVPMPPESFRTAFSNSVLEHIPDLRAVLDEVRRLLRPGGRFYVTVPTDRFELYSAAGRIIQMTGNKTVLKHYRAAYNRFWRHYNVHNEAGWRGLFEATGFDVVESRLYDARNICTFNDVFAVIAGPAMISKKVLGRWIAFPKLRRAIAPMLERALDPVVRHWEKDERGGLIFLSLRKP